MATRERIASRERQIAAVCTISLLASIFLFTAIAPAGYGQLVRVPVGVQVVADSQSGWEHRFALYCNSETDTCTGVFTGYFLSTGPIGPPLFVSISGNPPKLMFRADTSLEIVDTFGISWRSQSSGKLCDCQTYYSTYGLLHMLAYYDDRVYCNQSFGFDGYWPSVLSLNASETGYRDTSVESGLVVYNNTEDSVIIIDYALKMDSSIDVKLKLYIDSPMTSSLTIRSRSLAKLGFQLSSAATPFGSKKWFNGKLTLHMSSAKLDTSMVKDLAVGFSPLIDAVPSEPEDNSPGLRLTSSPKSGQVVFWISTPISDDVSVEVFDMLGRVVQRPFSAAVTAPGTRFEASLPAGVYFARMQTRSKVITRKIVVGD